MYYLLVDAENPISPEDLFRRAGLQADAVDDFYELLHEELKEGRIKEVRLDDTQVLLRVASDDEYSLWKL